MSDNVYTKYIQIFVNNFQSIILYIKIFEYICNVKTVVCQNNMISSVQNALGCSMPNEKVKAPQKGKEYRVTGELTFNGIVYYLLMGFGIKIAFRSDKFQDAV